MSTFNPRDHLRTLRGKGGPAEYLDVKYRLVWLRSEHPDAAIESDKVEGGIESNYAVFKARVSIPDGGSATGWGSETKADFADFLEKAETKAIGRALAALGYGTQFAPDLDEGDRLGDAPVDTPPPARNARTAATPTTPQDRPAPSPPAASGNPLTKQDFTSVMDRAWTMFEDGARYSEIVAYVRDYKPRMSGEQYGYAQQQIGEIGEKTKARESAFIQGGTR